MWLNVRKCPFTLAITNLTLTNMDRTERSRLLYDDIMHKHVLLPIVHKGANYLFQGHKR